MTKGRTCDETFCESLYSVPDNCHDSSCRERALNHVSLGPGGLGWMPPHNTTLQATSVVVIPITKAITERVMINPLWKKLLVRL